MSKKLSKSCHNLSTVEPQYPKGGGGYSHIKVTKALESTVINLYIISTLTGTTKTTTEDALKLNTLKGTKLDEHPGHFYTGVPTPHGPQYNHVPREWYNCIVMSGYHFKQIPDITILEKNNCNYCYIGVKVIAPLKDKEDKMS